MRFNKGEKIVCVNEEFQEHILSSHRVYTVDWYSEDTMFHVKEFNYPRLSENRFISLVEYRKLKIDKIRNTYDRKNKTNKKIEDESR